MTFRIPILAAVILPILPRLSAGEVRVRVEGLVQDLYGSVIMGAQVTARKTDDANDRILKTTSDSQGAFAFDLTRPGYYNLHAKADGYVEPFLLEGLRGLVKVDETAGDSSPVVRRVGLMLYRPATVHGRLVELENGARKPVASRKAGMVFNRFREGRMTLSSPVSTASSDANGVFRIERLPPGDYFVEVSPDAGESASTVPAGKAAAGSVRQRGYRRTYWPEGADSGYANPIRIDSGANIDLGEIEIRKGPFLRISGNVQFSGCSEEEKYVVTLFQEFGQAHLGRAVSSLPCQTPFVIDNVSPGNYQLGAWVKGRSLLERESVRLPIVVSDEDVKVEVQAQPSHRVQGNIEFPDNFAAAQRADLRVVLRPTTRPPFFDEAEPVPVDERGRFRLTIARLDECEIMLQGLQLPHYLKKISYNGSDLSGSIVALDPHAIDHHLKITVSDQPGTVDGLVTVKGDAAPGTRVLISRWPFARKGGYPVFVSCRADEKGRYSQSALAPGVYRVAAISDSARWRIERLDDAVQILSGGKEVEIAAGATASQDLEVNAW